MAERIIEGQLAGEFLKSNGAPDGRCCFRANDNSFVVLCYFKDGRKLKGPHLKYVPSKKFVEIRSKTWIDNGHQVCTLAVEYSREHSTLKSAACARVTIIEAYRVNTKRMA